MSSHTARACRDTSEIQAILARDRDQRDKPDTDEASNAGGEPFESPHRDYWRTQGDYVIRVHVQPRTKMFIPPDAVDPPPVEISLLDCARGTIAKSDITRTDRIDDVWTGGSPQDHRELPEPWTGETRFVRLDRKTFADLEEDDRGKPTRQQATERPP